MDYEHSQALRKISKNIKKNIFSDRDESFDYLSLSADEQKTVFAQLHTDEQKTALNQLLAQRKQIYTDLNQTFHIAPTDIANGAKLATLAVQNATRTAPVAIKKWHSDSPFVSFVKSTLCPLWFNTFLRNAASTAAKIEKSERPRSSGWALLYVICA